MSSLLKRQEDTIKALRITINELEAQVPDVGSFAWALMQDWSTVRRYGWYPPSLRFYLMSRSISKDDMLATDWEVTP